MSFVVVEKFHHAGIAQRKAILGADRVAQALAAEHDLIEYHHLLGHECAYAQVWSRPGLSKEVRSLVTVAMLGTLTPGGESFRAHVRGAVINGASRATLRQVMGTISFYLGAGTGTEAINATREELGPMSEQDLARRPVSAPRSRDEIRRSGAAMCRTLFGEAPEVQAADAGADAEAVYAAMRAEYIFGVLWSDPEMTPEVRVKVVIGILCAGNRQQQLRTYLQAARRLGCSHDEIREIFLTAAIYCGAPACEDGLTLAREVYSAA
ncbi:MAG: carboxymuconolactone decarboxylase family protein [Burkholderiaceae bacterium]|nr:carboxymuconolactone decarboxylase family protein [Burkholderiaceae bacterium]